MDRRRRHRRGHGPGRRLQRWLTLVPGTSEDALDPTKRAAAEDRFELWHTLLGKAIGETLGYALTATFTVFIVIALRRWVLPSVAGADRIRRCRDRRDRRADPRRGRGNLTTSPATSHGAHGSWASPSSSSGSARPRPWPRRAKPRTPDGQRSEPVGLAKKAASLTARLAS